MSRKCATKARKRLQNIIEEINGDSSDIENYVESSGDEYDICGEESSSSENESDDEVPLANLLGHSKDTNYNDEKESEVLQNMNENDDQDLADAVAQLDRQEPLQWGNTQFVPPNTTSTGKLEEPPAIAVIKTPYPIFSSYGY